MMRFDGFKGLNRMMSDFQRAESSIDKKVKQEVKRATAETTRLAQHHAPVDTGYLKRSIIMELLNNGFIGYICANAHYAPYQEFGTRFMAAQPFMGPAVKKTRPEFMADMKKLLEEL